MSLTEEQAEEKGAKWMITWSEVYETGNKKPVTDYSATKPIVGSHTVAFQNLDGKEVTLFRVKTVIREL